MPNDEADMVEGDMNMTMNTTISYDEAMAMDTIDYYEDYDSDFIDYEYA